MKYFAVCGIVNEGRNKKDSWLLLEEISIRMAGLTIHSEAC